MKKDKEKSFDHIIGDGTNKRLSKEELQQIQLAIQSEANKYSPVQKMDHKLLALKFKIQDYLQEKDKNLVELGDFLRIALSILTVKNKVFASYIGIEESNLSALINGRRKVNFDLALKFERIFDIPADLWLQLQNHNEMKQMAIENKHKYDQYSLEDLLKKAS